MSLLNNTIQASSLAAPKGIVYGSPGVGKTTFGAAAGNSIIVDCENGAGTIPCTRTPLLTDWLSIEQWLTELATGHHEYHLVVIDTIDWLIRRIEEHVSGLANDMNATLNRSHGGYGNGKQVLKNYIYQTLLPLLDKIIARNCAVVLLAHAKRGEITSTDGVTATKSTPDIAEDYRDSIIEWSDFVGLAVHNPDGSRMLTLTETPQALAKNRYYIDTPVDLSWTAFVQAIKENTQHLFGATTNG